MSGGSFVDASKVLALLLVLAAFLPLTTAQAASALEPGASMVHAPIVIEGDANFTTENGVISGHGTEKDPYLIQGWEIDAGNGIAVEINNTTAYFWLQVTVTAPDAASVGILLDNVTNGFLQNVFASGNGAAVTINRGDSITLTASYLSSHGWVTVWAEDSTRLNLSGNSFTAWVGDAVRLSLVTASLVADNQIAGTFYLFGTRDTVVQRNHSVQPAWSSGNRIDAVGCDHLQFSENDYATVPGRIHFEDTTNATLQTNLLGPWGLDLEGYNVAAYASHTISADNLVAGKPLRYVAGGAGAVLSGLDAGQIVVANTSAPTLSNVAASAGWDGILVAYTDGLALQSAWTNGTIHAGIRLEHVSHATLASLTISGGMYGVEADESSNVTVRDGSFTRLGAAASFLAVRDARMETSTATLVQNGVLTDHVSRFVVDGGHYTVNDTALNFLVSSMVAVSNVALEAGPSGGSAGLQAFGSSNGLMASSFISNFTTGALLDGVSSGWLIFGNRFVNNQVQAVDGMSATNFWNATYPGPGNFWSDYVGFDDCSGPAQDVCPAPDGFGDTPYTFDFGGVDHYPILENSPPNVPPVAVIAVATPVTYAGEMLELRAGQSWDPDGSIVAYAWTFGDGSAGSQDAYVQHRYAAASNYTVTLTVTDDRHGSNTTSVVVKVQPRPTLALTTWTSPEGYLLPVPTDWTRAENWTSGTATYDLYTEGYYWNTPANLLVDAMPDPAAKEDRAYIAGIVHDTIAELEAGNPGAIATDVTYRSLDGHTAATFVLRYPASIYQDIAIITSEAHQRTWMIILTAAPSKESDLNRTFEQILQGFEITASATTVTTVLGIDLLLVGLVVAVVLVAVVVVVVYLVLRSRRSRPPAPPMAPPSLPPPPGGP